jgi:cyclopropane-fatty-acyl-phospholipid synthase
MSRELRAPDYRNLGASVNAIQTHYDVGNAFYERFLGPTMAYSAGIWHSPAHLDTLDAAQDRKLDWHIDWSGSDTAARVLEIGCGWGSLIKRLAVQNPRARVTGVTMSEAQAAYVRDVYDGSASVAVTPWQNFRADRPFHSIVSIEALEHFTSIELTRDQRIQVYRDFFDFCAKNLVLGGRVTLQMSAWHNVKPGSESQFSFANDFFPESGLPHLAEIVAGADPNFHVMRIENDQRDHLYTLRAWLARLEKNEAALAREFGGDLVRHYIQNYHMFVDGFVTGLISLVRMALKRRAPGVAAERAKTGTR